MPHVVAVVLIGAGLYAGYRAFVRVQAEFEHREAEARAVIEKDLGTLEYDPVNGVYRPRQT